MKNLIINPHAANQNVPIVGQPKMKRAVGLAIQINPQLVEYITNILKYANAEEKHEVGVFFGDYERYFSLETFLAMVFPELVAEQASGGQAICEAKRGDLVISD